MQDLHLIQTVEEYSFRAWAALETENYDGWVLRFARGYTGRGNSINPIYPSTLDLERKVNYCAAWFASRGIMHRFRLNDAMQPPDLDTFLERKGYVHDNPSMVMVADLTALNLVSLPSVTMQLEPAYTETWLTNFCRLHPTHAPHLATMQAIMDCMPPTRYYASMWVDGDVVAMGLGVQEGEYVGLFDVITHPDQRSKGYASAMVSGILRQAVASGARTGYLQVMGGNSAAIKIYERLGYHPAYHYWYRLPPK